MRRKLVILLDCVLFGPWFDAKEKKYTWNPTEVFACVHVCVCECQCVLLCVRPNICTYKMSCPFAAAAAIVFLMLPYMKCGTLIESKWQANMRILISGGAGFIGSHLVDRLMEDEQNEVRTYTFRIRVYEHYCLEICLTIYDFIQVIVADNYFTGSKDNLKKWIGHPRFELIRHGRHFF